MQQLVVAASSLLYLLPALVFYLSPGAWNQLCAVAFVVVAVCSALADGSLLDPPYFVPLATLGLHPYAEKIDRWTATTGGAFAVLSWLCRPHPDLHVFALEIVFAMLCVLPLHWARVVSPKETWKWVLLQTLWHLASATTVASISPFPNGPLSIHRFMGYDDQDAEHEL